MEVGNESIRSVNLVALGNPVEKPEREEVLDEHAPFGLTLEL